METPIRTLAQVDALLTEYSAEYRAFEAQYRDLSEETRGSEVGKGVFENLKRYKGFCEELREEREMLLRVKETVEKKGFLTRLGGFMVIAAACRQKRKTKRNGGK